MKALLKKLINTIRMRTVTRIGLDLTLNKVFRKLRPGITLDVGSKQSPYKERIPFTKYMRLDIDKNTQPDICCDLHDIKWQSDHFDTVIATEVLEHLHSPERAINEIYRILKPGGVCIFSTRFIYPYHPDPQDYYRFTQDSLNHLFKKFSKVEICHHGNAIQAIWQIITFSKLGIILGILSPLFARIHFERTRCPCGFVVHAEK